ncbi:hypothetical protein [Vibrio hippocampi]|uniref:hypothetical protein n=1 Tax=Vibrio hippocampi TaxID=654686 RepID=UPI0025B67750|nr:hypothetical protein [Vibrio hippocampi]
MLSKLIAQVKLTLHSRPFSALLIKIDRFYLRQNLPLNGREWLDGSVPQRIYGHFVLLTRELQRSHSALAAQQQQLQRQTILLDQHQQQQLALKDRIHQLERLVAKLSQEQQQWLADAQKPQQNTEPKQLQQKTRQELVSAMNLALKYWQSQPQENKVTFATKSGLWRVYIDRGTPQTRTLDKYLNQETLPMSPRWRRVLHSIDYILQHCQIENLDREKLIALQQKLSRQLY